MSTTHQVPAGCVTEELLTKQINGELTSEERKKVAEMIHGGCRHCRGVWSNFLTKQPVPKTKPN